MVPFKDTGGGVTEGWAVEFKGELPVVSGIPVPVPGIVEFKADVGCRPVRLPSELVNVFVELLRLTVGLTLGAEEFALGKMMPDPPVPDITAVAPDVEKRKTPEVTLEVIALAPPVEPMMDVPPVSVRLGALDVAVDNTMIVVTAV